MILLGVSRWQEDPVGNTAPEPRWGATNSYYELIYMFGGKSLPIIHESNVVTSLSFSGKYNKKYFNDLWTYDPLNKKFKELEPYDATIVPPGRYLAAGAMLGDYLVYGGQSYEGVVLKDLWGYDVALGTWREVCHLPICSLRI